MHQWEACCQISLEAVANTGQRKNEQKEPQVIRYTSGMQWSKSNSTQNTIMVPQSSIESHGVPSMLFKTRIMMLVSSCISLHVPPAQYPAWGDLTISDREIRTTYIWHQYHQYCQILSSFSSCLTPCKLRLSLYMRRIQVSCPEFTGTNRLFFSFA